MKHYHYDVFEPYMIEGTKVDTSAAIEILFKFETDLSGEISGFEAKTGANHRPYFLQESTG